MSSHLERCVDLSAVLRTAEPLANVDWHQIELANNQYLIVYRGESPAQVFSNQMFTDYYVSNNLRRLRWWNQGVRSGIYLVTLQLPNSNGTTKKQQEDLCEYHGAQMAPFVINAMLRIANIVLFGKRIGGWNICPELTRSGYSASISWHSQLDCSDTPNATEHPEMSASSVEWLSDFE